MWHMLLFSCFQLWWPSELFIFALFLKYYCGKPGKHPESILGWQPKGLIEYAHYCRRTTDAYLLCFQPPQPSKEPFPPTMIWKARKASGKHPWLTASKIEWVCSLLPAHNRRLLIVLPASSAVEKAISPDYDLESPENIRKASLVDSLKDWVSILTTAGTTDTYLLCFQRKKVCTSLEGPSNFVWNEEVNHFNSTGDPV